MHHNQFLYRTSSQSFQLYWKDVCRIALLSTDEEIALIAMINNGDNEARQRLINANLRLVVAVALRFSDGGHLSFLDLVQAGNIGLVRAVDSFDQQNGCRFTSYAWSCIYGEIYRAVVSQTRTIRVPEHISTEINKFRKVKLRLEQELLRAVAPTEVITEMGGLSNGTYCAMEMIQDLISLDALVSGHGGGDDHELHDFIADKQSQPSVEIVLSNILRDDIRIIMSELTPRQQRIMEMRFGLNDGLNRTLEDIGREFGLSRERIRQIEIKALRKIRHTIKGHKLEGLQEYRV